MRPSFSLFLTVFAALSFSNGLSAFASDMLWKGLSQKQKADVQAGKLVRVDGSTAKVWSVTFYQAIRPRPATAKADPESAAAIFWDLKGQVEYLAKFGFTGVLVSAGEGTAAIRCVVKSLVPTPGGHQVLEYPQENAIYRTGNGESALYVSSWHSTDPSRGEHPGFLAVWGDVTFGRLPDGPGTLLAYRAVTVPAAEIAGTTALRENLATFYADLVKAHALRMAKGATPEQLRSLRRALGGAP
jgi:hypothetical protein